VAGRVGHSWSCGDAVLVVDCRKTCTHVRYCVALLCPFVTDDDVEYGAYRCRCRLSVLSLLHFHNCGIIRR
jgi:hypothetical protein